MISKIKKNYYVPIQPSEPCCSLVSPDDSLWLRGSDSNSYGFGSCRVPHPAHV